MTEQILHIKDGKKEYFLDLKDLLFIKADGNFCDIYQKVTAYKTVRIQIGQLWKAIKELNTVHTLIRVDRSTILNIKYLEFVDLKKGTAVLKRGEERVFLKISKSSGIPLKKKLDILTGESQKKPVELNPNDFPNEAMYKLHKSAEELKRTMARMNDLYLLAKDLNE